jgi:hypothetical protein
VRRSGALCSRRVEDRPSVGAGFSRPSAGPACAISRTRPPSHLLPPW